MSQDKKPTMSPMLPTVLAGVAAGAVLGAITVALTTPKTGPELRNDLKNFGRRAKRKTGDLADDASGIAEDLKDRTIVAAGELKSGISDATSALLS